MKNSGQLLAGLFTAAGTAILVLAAASLALLEGGAAVALVAATFTPGAPTFTPLPSMIVNVPKPNTPTITPTEEIFCKDTPGDWLPYTVQQGESIASLVVKSGTTTEAFLKANCFKSESQPLEPGWVVYLPPTAPSPTPTNTPTPELPTPTLCGAPPGWVNYIVRYGDTLYSIANSVGLTTAQLQQANCLPGTLIYAGQILRVPFLPPTSTRTPTPTPTRTELPPTETFTPTPSITISPTVTTPAATKQDQTITFNDLPDRTYGDPPFTVTATASSGLPVSFNAFGSCSIAGNTVTIEGAGVCTITASQAGNSAYNPAPDVSQMFAIEKATAAITLGALTFTYDGSPHAAAATTDPSGLTVNFSYDDTTTPPTNAGSYAVVAVVDDANYQGSAAGTLTINKASATVTLSIPSPVTYDGSPHEAAATTAPAGLAVTITYNGSTTAPTDAGTYAVAATVADANYEGSASGTLTIAKAAASVSLGTLDFVFDNTPKTVTATTTPGGLNVTITYNGGSTPPTAVGTYTVVATINDPNYEGSATGTMTISEPPAPPSSDQNFRSVGFQPTIVSF